MLIDKIILAKTKYTPEQFTGGSIQFTVSKYSKIMDIKLVLYFGFNATRNSISKQIKIQEKDVNTLNKELLLKTKAYLESLKKDVDTLCLDEFKKDSYECNTNIVRPTTKDSDSLDSDSLDSDNNASSFDNALLSDFEIDEAFNTIWIIHSERLKQIKTKDGNSRKNNDKGKTKERFINLLKKYNLKAIFCYVRNSTLGFSPKCLYNLFGKDIDEPLLKALNKVSQDVLDDALNTDDDADFLCFIEEIEKDI